MRLEITAAEQVAIEIADGELARGNDGAAVEALLPVLDGRAAAGDAACALAARALRRMDERFAPDALATALDRLVHLVREQEAQIRALRAMVESGL